MLNPLELQRLAVFINLKLTYLLVSLLLIFPSSVMACGHCLEDKVAAVYDHIIITKAVSEKHLVAFFGIEGPFVINTASKQEMQKIISSINGVDPNTSRVSLEAGSISLAFNPNFISYPMLLKSLEIKLQQKKLSIFPIDVISQMPKPTVATR